MINTDVSDEDPESLKDFKCVRERALKNINIQQNHIHCRHAHECILKSFNGITSLVMLFYEYILPSDTKNDVFRVMTIFDACVDRNLSYVMWMHSIDAFQKSHTISTNSVSTVTSKHTCGHKHREKSVFDRNETLHRTYISLTPDSEDLYRICVANNDYDLVDYLASVDSSTASFGYTEEHFSIEYLKRVWDTESSMGKESDCIYEIQTLVRNDDPNLLLLSGALPRVIQYLFRGDVVGVDDHIQSRILHGLIQMHLYTKPVFSELHMNRLREYRKTILKEKAHGSWRTIYALLCKLFNMPCVRQYHCIGNKHKNKKPKIKSMTSIDVDLDCPGIRTMHVLKKKECIWNAMMYRSDDQFYLIQLLRHKNKREYAVWKRWGKVDTNGQHSWTTGLTLSKAKKSFTAVFLEKTKNEWKHRNNFQPVSGRYQLFQHPTVCVI